MIPMTTFTAFSGRKSERRFSMPTELVEWVRDHVKLVGKIGPGRGTLIYSYPHLTTKNGDRRYSDRPTLSEYLRGKFSGTLAGLGHSACSEEKVYGLIDYLGLSDDRTGFNTNPNTDSSPNPERLTQTVFSPGAKR